MLLAPGPALRELLWCGRLRLYEKRGNHEFPSQIRVNRGATVAGSRFTSVSPGEPPKRVRHGIGFDRFPLLPLGLAPRCCRATRAQPNRREVGLAFPGSSFPAGLCGPLRSRPARGNGSRCPNRFVALPGGVPELCGGRPSVADQLFALEASGLVAVGLIFQASFLA